MATPNRSLSVHRTVRGHHGQVTERCVNRLKQFRAIATRYDKTALAFQALLLFAAIILWTR
jgi:transposase